MFDGFMKTTDIARLFSVKVSEIDKYIEVFSSAKMALKGKIQRNAISLGLQREDLLPLNFHLGLQYGEQTLNPAHEGVEDFGAGRDTTIKVVTKESAKSLLRADIQSLPSSAAFIS